MKYNMCSGILLLLALLGIAIEQSKAQQANAGANPVIDFQRSLGVRNDLERAMWLWHTEDIVYSVGTAKEDLFAFCANHKGVGDAAAPAFTQHPIDRLFFYAQGFIVSGIEERDSLRSFLREAHARGTRVDYLDGEPVWLAGDAGTSEKIMNAFVQFNNGSAPDERFDGVLLDIEPYRVNGWYSNALWNKYMNLLTTVEQTIHTKCKNVRFGTTIPRWYDETLGSEKLKELFRHVDYVTVLDYVNDEHRLVNDATDEIAIADTMNIKAYVTVETGANIIPTISFQRQGWLTMERDLDKLNSAFIFHKGYAGVAIHHYTPYAAMRRTPHSLEYANYCTETSNLDSAKLSKSNADILIVDNQNIDSKKVARNIQYAKNNGTAEQKRYVIAELPMMKALKIYNVLAAMESFRQNLTKDHSKEWLEENETAWTDSLAREVGAQIAAAMDEGFDGIQTDLNDVLKIAKMQDLPDPENKIVDMMMQMGDIIQKNRKELHPIVLAECDPDFIRKLDEKHYINFMELVDGAIFNRRVPNSEAYTAYGVKVFDPTNHFDSIESETSSNTAITPQVQ